MDCDLDEVSGQMVLPLPNQPLRTGPGRHSPASAGWISFAHAIASSRRSGPVPLRSPPDFQHRAPLARAATRMVAGADGSPRRAVRRLEPKEYRPMTVRWKPLLILSGLFLVVALIGVVAITLTLVPRSSQGILKRARAAREAGRFEDAEIYYKQALQLDAKNAAIHEEFAGLYRDWARHAAGREAGGPAHRTARPSGQRGQVRQGDQRTRQRAPPGCDGRGPRARLDLLGQGDS